MNRGKKVVLPIPGTPEAKKFLSEWSNAVRRLALFDPPAARLQVYIPRPSSASAFTDAMLGDLEEIVCKAITPVSVMHQLGGKVFTFASPKDAQAFRDTFPVTTSTRAGVHTFEAKDVPLRHEGTHVRFQGVPFTNDPPLLKRWLSSVIANTPSDLIFCDILKTKKGTPTDKVTAVFKVCPWVLLFTTRIPVPGGAVSAFFQDSWCVCTACDKVGHSAPQCPIDKEASLPSLDFSDVKYDPPDDDDENEKEEENESDVKDPKASQRRDGKHSQDPPKGKHTKAK
jgi:hypothetical protein